MQPGVRIVPWRVACLERMTRPCPIQSNKDTVKGRRKVLVHRSRIVECVGENVTGLETDGNVFTLRRPRD